MSCWDYKERDKDDKGEYTTADCAEVEEARLLPAGDPADDTGYEYDSPEEEL